MNILKTATETEKTLAEVWDVAETLGRLEVEQYVFEGEYRVTIKFEKISGTCIWARGKHKTIKQAIELAISEAKKLGA